ncbi:hypothetical protein [Nesterenkonia sp. AN1]|uniref:hypothetical protein n=1 Tax=Nesterenkonia sp. AN1 TaxID=652017 RepID=UPI001F3149E6|nr:hypothetical protein [Nesterenkonia sp. AN1]
MTESSTTDAAASTELESRYGAPRRSVSAKSQRWMILGALVLPSARSSTSPLATRSVSSPTTTSATRSPPTPRPR